MPSVGGIIHKLPAPIKQVIKNQVYPELLPEGETAPEFQLQHHDDSWHRLKKKWSILVFYPGDDTPGCTKQLQEFQENYERLQALGCEVYAINPAEAPSHKAFAEKYGFTFPVLTDRGGAVSRSYKATVSVPMKMWVLRTVYLINPERKIRLANRGNPSVEAIIRSIQALQQATKGGM